MKLQFNFTDRQLQNFDSGDYMGAQNFNFALKFPQHGRFLSPNFVLFCLSQKENFCDRLKGTLSPLLPATKPLSLIGCYLQPTS